jgi:hypothetical protein
MLDPSKISAASFWPGLQNVGQTEGEAYISGTVDGSPTSTNTSSLTGTIFIQLPDDQVISSMRINMPDAHGDLASMWFPVAGTLILEDQTADWRIIFTVGSASGGRNLYFNLVNQSTSATVIGQHVNIFAHLYTYSW